MALEYKFQIKTKLLLIQLIEHYLNERKIIFSKEIFDKTLNIDMYKDFGFMISFQSSEKIFLEYLIGKNETFDIEWDFSNSINFRLDKF